MKKAVIISICSLALVFSCGKEMPVLPDGDGIITLTVIDSAGTFPGAVQGENFVIAEAMINVQSRSHMFSDQKMSDSEGMTGFYDLPAGRYSLFARKEVVAGAQKKVFTGYVDIEILGTEETCDTIYVTSVTVNALMINEIMYNGSDASKFYFYDQFVEIYNSSADTLYLDGCILTRNYGNAFVEPGIEDIDHVRSLYAFQFPGTPVTGTDYPIYPGQYVAVAADAIDHSVWADNAVDLSGADWEFFNPLGNDYDVPHIPNLVSIHPTSRNDFMISLVHNAVILATGEEYEFEEYTQTSGYISIRINFPLYTVIDGVEYSTNPEKTKELTIRVDAGFAGIGNPKYGGLSVERREIGVDTNHSTFDFVNIVPTPGWSHVDQGATGRKK